MTLFSSRRNSITEIDILEVNKNLENKIQASHETTNNKIDSILVKVESLATKMSEEITVLKIENNNLKNQINNTEAFKEVILKVKDNLGEIEDGIQKLKDEVGKVKSEVRKNSDFVNAATQNQQETVKQIRNNTIDMIMKAGSALLLMGFISFVYLYAKEKGKSYNTPSSRIELNLTRLKG